jgi:hypothetical protein
VTGETTARLAELTMRASGLSAWTQAGQWAFGMDFLSHITHVRGQAFDTLAPPFRRTLGRYGIDAGKWDAIRATPLQEHDGAQWIMAQNMDKPLADRVMRMILTETDFAVPNVTLATRAMFGQIPKGTLIWEIVRSPLLFKTFSASIMMTHGHRMMQHQSFNRLAYGAGLTVTTGLLGALAMQMQAISRGTDPQPMEDPAFWVQAMAQGGGLGIYGDFLKSATDRHMNSLATAVAGPMWSDMQQYTETLGEGYSAAKGDSNHLGREVLRTIKGDLPGGSLWYAKLAFQRAVLDQIQRQIDPDYTESFSRMEGYAHQHGQQYFWQPGETTPQRAPDLTNAAKPAPVH